MREILFRGKRVDNGEWVYGYLYITHNGEYEIGCYNKTLGIERVTHIVIPETVGQYTGLTDKNGKRIFEGDIVRFLWEREVNAVVKIGEYKQRGDEDDLYPTTKCYGVHFRVVKGGVMEYAKFLPEWGLILNSSELCGECEVIGNIHDNPELLEVENGCNER